MKKHMLLFFTVLTLMACKNDDDQPSNPIDQLPALTFEGKNSLGCLVNGEVLLPSGGGIGGNRTCFYQFVDGKYFFVLSFKNDDQDILRSVNPSTQNIVLKEDLIIPLNTDDFSDGGNAQYRLDAGLVDTFNTTEAYTGELHIIKFDPDNNIVSGTFWFDAVNEEGEVVEIREGRFDMTFTR